jgi:methionyl-tRNA formyltransferase
MKPIHQIGLFAMSSKGHATLKALIDRFGAQAIGFVVGATDGAVHNDHSQEIAQTCHKYGIQWMDRHRPDSRKPAVSLMMAVSWRWLLDPPVGSQLVVLHDSLLPRYRGFAPLVNSLINGEPHIGVSAVLVEGMGAADSGPIVLQRSVPVDYPITIGEAIALIEVAYSDLACDIVDLVMSGPLIGVPQVESEASFSPWLDDLDYEIDWTLSAQQVRRFVDAVGYPYRGAATELDGRTVRVIRCEEHPKPPRLERPAPGKVIMIDPRGPCVACGSGAVILLDVRQGDSSLGALPLKRFRVRFGRRRA